MLKLDLNNEAVRFLKKRDSKQFMQLLRAISELCDDPRPSDSISMNNGSHFRKDVGEFRVVYCFDTSVLNICVIGKRNDSDAYREFDRKR